MRFLSWALWAFIFFTLFAFALNNQQAVTVHWFFSYAWSTSMVIVVLAAFGAGAAFGIVAMTPAWWRHRRRAQKLHAAVAAAAPAAKPQDAPADPSPPIPDVSAIRDGL